MPKSTNKNYIFIADFFVDQILGGGELNNEEFINLLEINNFVKKINSHLVSTNFLSENVNSKFIVSNFVNLKEDCKFFLQNNCNYIIYEHDHKYLSNRNPAQFENFIAPKEKIINFDFYKNAKAVFCQSNFHRDIVKNNLNLNNIISLSGNLWSSEALDKIKQFSKKQKRNKCSIMDSSIPHKSTQDAKRFCIYKKIDYELISSCAYYEFLDRISNNDTFVFFPKTPETLSRIVVEAKMMNMKIITNKLVGATKEDWFKLKGNKLIDIMVEKRNTILHVVEESLND